MVVSLLVQLTSPTANTMTHVSSYAGGGLGLSWGPAPNGPKFSKFGYGYTNLSFGWVSKSVTEREKLNNH